MTIKAKILLLVAAFALMAAGISALGLMTMSDYDRVIADYSRASDNAFRGERLNLLLSEVVIDMRNIYIAKTPDVLKRRTDAMVMHMNATTALLNDWKAQLRSGEVPQFARVDKDSHAVISHGFKVIDVALHQSPQAAQAAGTSDAMIAWREAFQSRVDAMVAGIQAQKKARQDALEAYRTQRVTTFLLIAGSGTLLLLAASLWIAIKSIANPLKNVTQSVVRIAEGAYDTVIPTSTRKDEISRLWGAVAILKDRAIEAKRLTDEKLELRLD